MLIIIIRRRRRRKFTVKFLFNFYVALFYFILFPTFSWSDTAKPIMIIIIILIIIMIIIIIIIIIMIIIIIIIIIIIMYYCNTDMLIILGNGEMCSLFK